MQLKRNAPFPLLAGEQIGMTTISTPSRRPALSRIIFGWNVGMDPILTRNPNVMHGTPCFAGTRVAVQTFIDHLEAGYTIDRFLEQFPTVRRQQVLGLLELLRQDAARVAVPA